jgi:hypothetical protein
MSAQYIQLKSWDSLDKQNQETDAPISIYTLARSMSSENFSTLLDEYLNFEGKGFREG